jgi:hypothetical protein
MANTTGEDIANTAADALASNARTAENIVKGNTEALQESGAASSAAIQELTKAYQELATKNVRNLTAAMEALAKVKSPTEFLTLQQRLVREGVESAVSDSQTIARLTTQIFTAAFEPVKKQVESMQKATKN